MDKFNFQICSNPIPKCIGRKELLNRLVNSLTKKTAGHVQIHGSRFAGKTVVLNELVSLISQKNSPYTAIVYWDLAHQSLDNDADFFRIFALKLAQALKINHLLYAEHLLSEPDLSSAEIAEVLEAIKGENGKVLVVLDGLDKTISNERVTRNLWDQFRELAIKPSLRLVTASRKRLSELITNTDSASSPFWNIFDPSVRIGPFDEHDLDCIFSCLTNINITPGARTELLNATNANPIMLLEVLNAVLEIDAESEIDDEAMVLCYQKAYFLLRDRLNLLWEDCTPTSKDLFHRVRSQNSIPKNLVSYVDAEMLIERGFVFVTGNKLHRASRLLGIHLDELPNEESSLARLFSNPIAYETNLRTVFQHRISQIKNLSSELEKNLKHLIREIPNDPNYLLRQVRGFENDAFELIWRFEIPDKRIPSSWMSVWLNNGERRVDEWKTTFPQGFQRVRLLKLMTGSELSAPCAQFITKQSYVLMNAVHGFGDFGQHQDGAAVSVGSGYAALHLCLELALSLNNDFMKQS